MFNFYNSTLPIHNSVFQCARRSQSIKIDIGNQSISIADWYRLLSAINNSQKNLLVDWQKSINQRSSLILLFPCLFIFIPRYAETDAKRLGLTFYTAAVFYCFRRTHENLPSLYENGAFLKLLELSRTQESPRDKVEETSKFIIVRSNS